MLKSELGYAPKKYLIRRIYFMKKRFTTTKMTVLLGLFIAMSVIGAYIKIPNPITSSIALDSLPAYLCALILGGVPGAIIGFLGHMISAATAGFPLTLPIHLLIGLEMSLIMLIFSYIAKRFNIAVAIVIGFILNGICAPASLIIVPGFGIAAFTGSVVPLSIASALNILVSCLIYQAIKNIKIVKEMREVKNEL